jgi:hypothetical protein
MFFRSLTAMAFLAVSALAQEPAPAPQPEAAKPAEFVVEPGTRVPLSLINSISTKHSLEGDKVYLETSFPVLAGGRIVIPVGSWVSGTVTQVKRPGRVKGKAELYVRFDSLVLPNGVTRDFRARIGGMDGNAPGTLDRHEGKVIADGNKLGDAKNVGEAAGAGTEAGGIIGAVGGHPMMGVGIGAAAGAAAGLIGVLVTRGPDAVLAKGTTIEMVLDRQVVFNESEVNFAGYQPPRAAPVVPAAVPASKPGILPRR